MKTMYVYILTNKSKSTVYFGVTSDLKKRLTEHKDKVHPTSFTAKYNIHILVYYEVIEGQFAAIEREKQIKKYSREKKNALIDERNPNWEELKFE
jgi:putative endonuclease